MTKENDNLIRMPQPLISICIPTYKRAGYIGRCLESALTYQGDDIEVIVQENCSPDNTREEIARFLSDTRLKYYRNETNIGVIRNIWNLQERANGTYILFLTDDDFLLPGSVNKFKKVIESNSPSCIKGDLIVYMEKLRESFLYKALSDKNSSKSLSSNDYAKIFLTSNILTGLCFKKEELKKYNYSTMNNNLYPSMLIMGLLLKDSFYMPEPLAVHTWENETHWGVNPGSREVIRNETEVISYMKGFIANDIMRKIVYKHSMQHLFCFNELMDILDVKSRVFLHWAILCGRLKRLIMKIARILLKR